MWFVPLQRWRKLICFSWTLLRQPSLLLVHPNQSGVDCPHTWVFWNFVADKLPENYNCCSCSLVGSFSQCWLHLGVGFPDPSGLWRKGQCTGRRQGCWDAGVHIADDLCDESDGESACLGFSGSQHYTLRLPFLSYNDGLSTIELVIYCLNCA